MKLDTTSAAHALRAASLALDATRSGRPARPMTGEAAATVATPDEARLRALAHQMEGVFLGQLFQAMRASVPHGEGVLAVSPGEEMFTSLMDEKLSQEAAEKMTRGVGEALYRQLAKRLAHDEGTPR